jgi:hypothetical protein
MSAFEALAKDISVPASDEVLSPPEAAVALVSGPPAPPVPVVVEQDLSFLNEAAGGVDFNALRDKYRNKEALGSIGVAQASIHPPPVKYSEEEIAKTNQALDKYSICKTCHGLGIITEVYNHYRIDKTCPECDGEVLTSRRFSDLASELNLDAAT